MIKEQGSVSVLFMLIISALLVVLTSLTFYAQRSGKFFVSQTNRNLLQIDSMQHCDSRLISVNLCAWELDTNVQSLIVQSMPLSLPDVFLMRVKSTMSEAQSINLENIILKLEPLIPMTFTFPQIISNAQLIWFFSETPIGDVFIDPIASGIIDALNVQNYHLNLAKFSAITSVSTDDCKRFSIAATFSEHPLQLIEIIQKKVESFCACDLRTMMSETRVSAD